MSLLTAQPEVVLTDNVCQEKRNDDEDDYYYCVLGNFTVTY